MRHAAVENPMASGSLTAKRASLSLLSTFVCRGWVSNEHGRVRLTPPCTLPRHHLPLCLSSRGCRSIWVVQPCSRDIFLMAHGQYALALPGHRWRIRTAARVKVNTADTVSLFEACHLGSHTRNNSRWLMGPNVWQGRVEFTLVGHAVGMTEPARFDLDQQLMGFGSWYVYISRLPWLFELSHLGCFHRLGDLSGRRR